MKSILQKDRDYCFICHRTTGMKYIRTDLEEHHIIEGSRRKLSEKYGLKVYLCPEHHQFGEDAVHRNPNQGYDLMLKQMAQEVFKQKHPELDFIGIFGKSYL